MGSAQEELRLNSSASFLNNGYSAALATDVPLVSPSSPRTPRHRLKQAARVAIAATIFVCLLATLVALIAATVIRCRSGMGCLAPWRTVGGPWGGVGDWPPDKTVSRIAFGSCTAYDIREQPIWEQGIIPSQPDAFVWLGDLYYGDEPDFECKPEYYNSSACTCEADFLHMPPFNCAAGDLDNAREKMVAQVQQPGYQAFLRYMCPGFEASGATVPAGDDISVCPRPIMGVYDDHDFGANNFNRRLPLKHLLKQVYLDALGVAANSPRRAAQQGINTHYRLNPGSRQEVDLVLLDERYQRAPLPCEIRGDWCREIVLKAGSNLYTAWCEDFLHSGGASGQGGSCCKADSSLYYGWCQQESSKADPLWNVACNASSPQFGMRALAVQEGRLVPRDTQNATQTEEDSTFCELLGPAQRRWLEGVLSAATATVKIIASGSVVFGSTGLEENSKENAWQGRCGGDDWDCYRPAQLALLHTLQRHAAVHGGCWIIITGDYHYSDIKVAWPGTGQNYSSAYETAGWSTPLYQVMASGMTNSTARPSAPCASFRREKSGLRIEGDCGFVSVPAFGMLDFDWRHRRLSMQVRGGEGSAGGSVLQQLTISLDTCRPV